MSDRIAPEFIALQQAVIGRYSLERELGRGGMGIVFLARDVALDRLVAVKLLPPAMAAQPALRERFLREAQLAAKLSHPNIIPIFSVEQIADLVFFVMAFVEGETLGQRLRARGALNAAQASRMLQEVAWALAYAHLRGIVHRDIKPDNILVEAGSGRALVSDFGIARAGDTSGGTAIGEVLGTAQYMSPEQACGEAVDGRADLYSLGVVGFFALSGQLPFDAPDIPSLLAQHITRPAPPLLSVQSGVPRRLAEAIDRCLLKDPAERFQTGEQLGEAVALSTAVAREMPAPLRVWLTKGEAVRGALHGWTWLMGIGFVADLATTLFGGGTLDFDPLLLAMVPWAVYALYRLYHTQRALSAGFGLDDLRLSLRQHAEQKKEELAFEYDREPPLLAKALRWATFGAVGLAIVTGMVLTTMSGDWEEALPLLELFGYAVAGSLGGAALGRIFPGKRLKASDSSTGRRARLWASRFGQWVVQLASVGMTRAALPAASAFRPTEVAIGLAAVALFEALPKETRRSLRDLPQVIRRLEADAAATRARVDELTAMLAGVSDAGLAAASTSLRHGSGTAASLVSEHQEKLRTDLERQRDAASRRMAATVAALENLRLDLLRLKAGVGTVDELSADLTAARDLQQDIELAIEANRDLRAVLAGGDSGRTAS